MANKTLLICDLDNTLYDWVGYFVPSFYAMVDATVEITGCDKDKLLNDFRRVHQKYGDSEQPFALLETETIKNLYPDSQPDEVLKILDPAFHAFNSARKKHLMLHPGVLETLDTLLKKGVRLVAHTESKLYAVVDRLNRLELFPFFSRVYCRERTSLPHPRGLTDANWLERFPMNKIVELSHHQTKPDPAVLLEICADEKIETEGVAYIGDSIARDVLMAKRANVFAIWAAYGAQHDAETYGDLVRISHWTSEEVAREKRLTKEAQSVEPDFTACTSFCEVLSALKIGMPTRHLHVRRLHRRPGCRN